MFMSVLNSMQYAGFIFLIFLTTSFENNVEVEEVKDLVDNAVDNIVGDFVKMEEKIRTEENGFG